MRADPAEFNGKRFNTTSGDTPQSFQDWVYDWERIGLQDNIGDAQGEDSDIVIGEVNCSDDDENICLEGNCQIIVRWNDSRGEAIELAEGARGSDKTESAAEFSVCTRIAQ
ncbi:MAG TPA: hypothetical protein DIW77_22580 [Chromatiaceae bacterium]|nr:hypothetical protein [Chromatiaceae bacterium]